MKNHDPTSQPRIEINIHHSGKILKNLTNGKRAGFSNASHEMYKYLYDLIWELIQKLCDLFDVMINTGLVQFHFNIAIMIRIVKDAKKDMRSVQFTSHLDLRCKHF